MSKYSAREIKAQLAVGSLTIDEILEDPETPREILEDIDFLCNGMIGFQASSCTWGNWSDVLQCKQNCLSLVKHRHSSDDTVLKYITSPSAKRHSPLRRVVGCLTLAFAKEGRTPELLDKLKIAGSAEIRDALVNNECTTTETLTSMLPDRNYRTTTLILRHLYYADLLTVGKKKLLLGERKKGYYKLTI